LTEGVILENGEIDPLYLDPTIPNFPCYPVKDVKEHLQLIQEFLEEKGFLSSPY